jgi:hypothetical protein
MHLRHSVLQAEVRFLTLITSPPDQQNDIALFRQKRPMMVRVRPTMSLRAFQPWVQAEEVPVENTSHHQCELARVALASRCAGLETTEKTCRRCASRM